MKIFFNRFISISSIILFLLFFFHYNLSSPPEIELPSSTDFSSQFPRDDFHPINPLEIEQDITHLNNDYFMVSTKDGYIHLYRKQSPPSKIWSLSLGGELLSTNIINKNIIYESKVLIPMEGKLFILTNKSEVQFEEFTIPITNLINRAPFSLGFMPEYYFLGNKSTRLITIDMNKGVILPSEFEASNNNKNMINVFRVDYTLICCKNNEQVWNTTVSDIILVDRGSRNELMLANDNYEIVNSFLDSGEVKRGDIISVHDYDYKRHAPIKLFDRRATMQVKETVNNFIEGEEDNSSSFSGNNKNYFEHFSLLNNVLKWKNDKRKNINHHRTFYQLIFDYLRKLYQYDNYFIIMIDVILFGSLVGIFMRMVIMKTNKKKENNNKENELIKKFYSETKEAKNIIPIESSLFKKKSTKLVIADKDKLDLKKNNTNPIQYYDSSDKENINDQNDKSKKTMLNRKKRFNSFHNQNKRDNLSLIDETIIQSRNQIEQIEEISPLSISKHYKKDDENEYDFSTIIKNKSKIKKLSEEKQLDIQTISNNRTEENAITLTNPKAQTRLEKDFSEFVKIGQGGFGCVLKARHRIDEEIYAIKIIRLEYPNEQNVVKEAKTMTKIHSKHIVEYKTCWFDTSLGSLADLVYSNDDEEGSILSHSISITKSKSYSKLNKKFAESTIMRPLDKIMENEEEDKDEFNNINLINCNGSTVSNNFLDDNNSNDPNIIFEEEKIGNDCSNHTGSNVKAHNNYNDSYITKKIFDESLSDAENTCNKSINKSITSNSKEHTNIWDFRDDTSKSVSRNSNISRKELCKLETYFFIQMEFCDGLSLKQYIEEKKSTGLDKETIFIFSFQLAKSLKKIHNKNIIHRDIKPDNIFVYNNNSIKIGDFGLATEVKNDKNGKNFFSPSKSRNGSRVNLREVMDSNTLVEGTPIYLSPEQLERKSIDGKVDIYAMGLVLYEMCACFETCMERRTSIENLKNNRIICEKVKNNYPIQTKLILKMTERKPIDRPTACEILNSEEFTQWEKSLENTEG